MVTFVAAMLMLVLLVSLYLYVSGVFKPAYLGAFRFAFYLLVVLFALTVGIGLMRHPYEGGHTVKAPVFYESTGPRSQPDQTRIPIILRSRRAPLLGQASTDRRINRFP